MVSSTFGAPGLGVRCLFLTDLGAVHRRHGYEHEADLDLPVSILLNDAGNEMYGPAGLALEVGSLEGRGTIAGKTVRCETAEFQVRGHTTYTPDATDYGDVEARCEAFGIEMPSLFKDLGFH